MSVQAVHTPVPYEHAVQLFGHVKQVPVLELMYCEAVHPQIPLEAVNVVAHVVHAVKLVHAVQLAAHD